MLRAISTIFTERQATELFTASRRDISNLFRSSGVHSTAAVNTQTVLVKDGSSRIQGENRPTTARSSPATTQDAPPSPPPPPPPLPPSHRRRSWAFAAAAAVTMSLGGIYMYRRMNAKDKRELGETVDIEAAGGAAGGVAGGAVAPAEALPEHVEFLLAGGGTASFAALRALRAARPEARVLLVGAERAPPYMRPPLSKELWREPELARRAASAASAASAADPTSAAALTFTQWNGRRRSVLYEPSSFYTPLEQLSEGSGGAAVALGWRVTGLDVPARRAELRAPGQPPRSVRYDKCLIATGSQPKRVPALREAAAAGRALVLRGLDDVARLAAALDEPRVRSVVLVGGGFLACELGAALAHRLRGGDKTVVQVFREEAPLAGVLPGYLAAEAARRLRAAGVLLRPRAEVASAELEQAGAAGAVRLRLAGGDSLRADVVVECAGCEPAAAAALAAASGLETHPRLGGVLVNAELQARSGVFAAGDAACFYDVALGRRRVEHHDHAVVSGRLAGHNMAAAAPPQHYTHQSMFWSDLGPDFGFEAIGVVDASLETVGVFCADAVSAADATNATDATDATDATTVTNTTNATDVVDATDAAGRRYERGVVFYVRDERVVGVLLWNLFNRMHIARQVLTMGKFDDLFEVAKLFSLHEEEQAEENA